jgi:hypothetical protein
VGSIHLSQDRDRKRYLRKREPLSDSIGLGGLTDYKILKKNSLGVR